MRGGIGRWRVLANAGFALVIRHDSTRFWLAAIAAGIIVVNFIIFFIWTFPANQATENWTKVVANWETLRTQWEYSHAVNAILTFLALVSVTWAALSRRG